jgi:ribosomal protein S18 acetylase RimI-like enzyme
VILRDAHSLDAGRLGAILAGFQADTPWMPDLWTGAECIAFCGRLIDEGIIRVAEDGGVVGFIARRREEVLALYVAPGTRGRGIGSRLLAEAQKAEASLNLRTFEVNHRARAFYGRHGFVEAARGDGSGNDEGLPDILLTWERKAP